MSNPFGGEQWANGPEGRGGPVNGGYAGRPGLIPPHALMDGAFQTSGMPPYGSVALPADFCIPWGGRDPRSPMPRYTPEAGPTGVVVSASHFRMYLPVDLLAFTGPRIFVNGQEVPASGWGDTFIPLAPGMYRVRVCTAGVRRAQFIGLQRLRNDFGFTDAFIPVAHGHSTRTYYRSPIVAMLPGALDPQPQKSPGMVWFYLVATVLAVFVGFMLYAVAANIAGW